MRPLIDAIRGADVEGFGAALRAVDLLCIWPRAWAAVAKLPSAPEPIREYFLDYWIKNGEALCSESKNDRVLTRVLRVLLPSYIGGPLTLYRGDGFRNRRRRTYGMCWTADRDIGDAFARAHRQDYEQGTVLLATEGPGSRDHLRSVPAQRSIQGSRIRGRPEAASWRARARSLPQFSPEEYQQT